jgi:hypothetical protein
VRLLISDQNGVYIPQFFARWYSHPEGQPNQFTMGAQDLSILLDGPDHPDYWDVWDSIKNPALFFLANGRGRRPMGGAEGQWAGMGQGKDKVKLTFQPF